jgi:hypothetical protein
MPLQTAEPMIILGKPYVSDFLLRTIRDNHYPLIASSEAREMIRDPSLNWISETDASAHLVRHPEARIYTNSENTISWVEKHTGPGKLPEQIRKFKNKVKFREMLADIYPAYAFRAASFSDLETLDPQQLSYPLMIKPAVGFFSIGVHRVEHAGEWKMVLAQISKDLDTWEGTFPSEVIDTTEFILEDCIEGEEYAIDCYYDAGGQAVILNMLFHAFSSGKDVSDRVYTTSEHIFDLHRQRVQDFLETVGEIGGLSSFPVHVEVRIDAEGRIVPIEMNPLRFGGWCTTGDLTWFAYGFNSYEYFFESRRPDWEQIFKSRKAKKFSVVVLDNNSGLKESQIRSFDYEMISRDFEKVLQLRKVDFRRYGVFGFLFVETSDGNEAELSRILNSDLRKYIRLS